MRRSFVAAIAAASLLVAASTGSVLAKYIEIPGMLDQAVAPGFDGGNSLLWYQIQGSSTTIETITPAHSGLLTYVEMACRHEDGGDVTLSVGTSTAVGYCSDGKNYTRFIFANPPSVVAGVPFALGIDTGGTYAAFTFTTVDYAGGGLSDGGSPVVIEGDPSVTIASFAFMSYVLQPPTTTYSWNPTSVVAGQATSATLTAVTKFPVSYAIVDAVKAARPNTPDPEGTFPFKLTLAALPAWFTPTGIQCDAAVTNCSIANFSAGLTGSINGLAASTVTVTVTGTAAPPSGATSASGTTGGNGCNSWDAGDATASYCGTGQSILGIVGQPTPAPTLPPTNTSGNSPSGGPSPWLLLWTLPALLAGAAATLRRREVRDRN